MSVQIKACQSGHVDACIALAVKVDSWLQEHNCEVLGQELWTAAMGGWKDDTEKNTRELCDTGKVFVAEIDGNVVAFCGYRPNGKIGTISRLAYDPAYMNEDAAAVLCQYVLDDMKAGGITHAVTDCTNEPVRGAVQPVFAKVGFEKNLPHVRYFQTLGPEPELPPTQLQIVPAGEEHIESCIRISQQLWTVIHQGYIDAIGEDLHEVFSGNWRAVHAASITAQLRRGCSFVAMLDGEVVGFCGYRTEKDTLGVISYNGVDPAHRGKGIARYMYEYAFSRVREMGINHFRVYTGRDVGHGPARRAYEKAGFDHALTNATYYKAL